MTATPVDISECDREPIHIPGSIQPHGVLLAVTPDDGIVVQASENASAALGLDRAPLGRPLKDLDGGSALLDRLTGWWRGDDASVFVDAPLGGEARNIAAHRSGGLMVVEVETPTQQSDEAGDSLQRRLGAFLNQLQGVSDWREIARRGADEVQALTGFDRVLVYRFDEDWHGVVVGETNTGRLPSYLDLRFPASDIPSQARELYRLNRVRIIPDAWYRPSPIVPPDNPLTGAPLDLSFSLLRSVSPVHVEYMRNMGTDASMSISIVVEGALWGLISCHHSSARQVSIPVRAACDVLTQILALQLASRIRMQEAERRIALKGVQGSLLARMSDAPVFTDVLAQDAEAWTGLANATGAALVSEDAIITAGATPDDDAIRAIADWLKADGSQELATDALPDRLPDVPGLAEHASGLLAVSVSELHASYMLWFRPEVVRTVTWAGDPTKPVRPGERLHPRQSFASWTEQVRGRSEPWRSSELDTAREFRDGVIHLVLRRAEERAALTGELERSNRELEAFSYSISHDLRAPFRHIVGFAELLGERGGGLDDKSRHYITSIQDAALAAGRLVDDLLRFSHLNRSSLRLGAVDMNKLMAETRRSLSLDTTDRAIEWRVDDLPSAWGDPDLLRQVLLNLVGNAVKYTRPRTPAIIDVSGEVTAEHVTYSVSDNGVGFDETYANKLYGVFQRLHRAEDFEGTGIGLAIVKRIIDRHGGDISASGEVGQGAAFRFTLPLKPQDPSHRV